LAFTTIPGASATDVTSFIGTDGVDILDTFSTLSGLVEAEAANDIINLSNTVGLVDWTVRGADGSDRITVTSDIVGGLYNGNAGQDTIDIDNVFGGARVLGGQDNDTMTVVGTIAGSSVNGNKGNDNMTVTGSLSGASVFGGQGTDFITVNATAAGTVLTNSLIDGNLGGARITISAAATTVITNVEVNGGEEFDTINAGAVAYDGAANALGINQEASEGFTISANEGNDSATGTGRDDTISGGDGNDTINGGAGADQLTGGDGSNLYQFGGAAAVTAGGTETWVGTVSGAGVVDATALDVITDFKAIDANIAPVDTIRIAGVGAGALTVASTSYATINDAINGETVGAAAVEVVAIGSGGSFQTYLLINSVGAGAAGGVDGAIKLGNGTYGSVAAATNIGLNPADENQAVIIAGNIVTGV
jgi:hypothetical protein